MAAGDPSHTSTRDHTGKVEARKAQRLVRENPSHGTENAMETSWVRPSTPGVVIGVHPIWSALASSPCKHTNPRDFHGTAE